MGHQVAIWWCEWFWASNGWGEVVVVMGACPAQDIENDELILVVLCVQEWGRHVANRISVNNNFRGPLHLPWGIRRRPITSIHSLSPGYKLPTYFLNPYEGGPIRRGAAPCMQEGIWPILFYTLISKMSHLPTVLTFAHGERLIQTKSRSPWEWAIRAQVWGRPRASLTQSFLFC
jgi:hypothetical protein